MNGLTFTAYAALNEQDLNNRKPFEVLFVRGQAIADAEERNLEHGTDVVEVYEVEVKVVRKVR